MASLIGGKSMPPGFRFHPTDEELCMFYLKRKILGKSLCPKMISEVDVYRFPPWDLPSKSCLKTRDLNWFFFCPRSKKYPHGGRANRSTEYGYWKATGNDRTIKYNHRPVGKIKTLIFYIGKAPHGERTDWVMYEYRLEDKVLVEKGVLQDAYVICKVYKKSGLGPKNGQDYGAPFIEEEWDSEHEDNAEKSESQLQRDCLIVKTLTDKPLSIIACDSAPVTGHTSAMEHLSGVSSGCNETVPLANMGMEEDDIDTILAMFSQDNDASNGSLEDIFGGLGDLSECCGLRVGSNWSMLGDENEYFIELNDLN